MGKRYQKEELIQLFKQYVDKNGIPKRTKDAFKSKNGLASWDTYQKIVGIKTILELVDICNIIISEKERLDLLFRGGQGRNYTKNEVIERIHILHNRLNRDLYYDDFRNPQPDEIGIATIRRHWKTMNDMKKELNLNIVQENMIEKHVDFEAIIEDIQKVANEIYESENRKLLMMKDFNKLSIVNSNTIWKQCKDNNTTLDNELNKIGFKLQDCGRGMNFKYKDGEMTASNYEYLFTNKLRALGYNYNTNYKRDIKYREFIIDYNNLMNCDYVITINNNLLYIELAGMLEEYEKEYKSDNILNIKSKSKKLYAEKLKLKENMFIENGLNYFILFPSDLKEDNLDFLFENKLNIQRKDAI
jgi:hypothetical protein